MEGSKLVTLALGAIIGSGILVSLAQGEEMLPYCRSYANAAVQQARAARALGRCMHLVRENAARGSLNAYVQFNWCQGVYGSGDNSAERRAREADLDTCTKG